MTRRISVLTYAILVRCTTMKSSFLGMLDGKAGYLFDHSSSILLVFFHVATDRARGSVDHHLLPGAKRRAGVLGEKAGSLSRRIDRTIIRAGTGSDLRNVCVQRGSLFYPQCRSDTLFLQ